MTVEQSCYICRSPRGGDCPYAVMGAGQIWSEIKRRVHRLALSTDQVWNFNEERAVLNLLWHYRQREPAEQTQLKME